MLVGQATIKTISGSIYVYLKLFFSKGVSSILDMKRRGLKGREIAENLVKCRTRQRSLSILQTQKMQRKVKNSAIEAFLQSSEPCSPLPNPCLINISILLKQRSLDKIDMVRIWIESGQGHLEVPWHHPWTEQVLFPSQQQSLFLQSRWLESAGHWFLVGPSSQQQLALLAGLEVPWHHPQGEQVLCPSHWSALLHLFPVGPSSKVYQANCPSWEVRRLRALEKAKRAARANKSLKLIGKICLNQNYIQRIISNSYQIRYINDFNQQRRSLTQDLYKNRKMPCIRQINQYALAFKLSLSTHHPHFFFTQKSILSLQILIDRLLFELAPCFLINICLLRKFWFVEGYFLFLLRMQANSDVALTCFTEWRAFLQLNREKE